PLYAWVESGNSNTSTATNIWVKLPNGIPANSSITIYMKLEPVGTEYDGVYMGEAPQLSSTYAQFDNGSNVFNNYWNFAGTVLPSNLTYTVLSNPSGASGSYSVNNGLTITNIGGSGGSDFWHNYYNITLIYYNTPITMPFIAQSYLTSLTGNSSDGGWTKFGILLQNTISDTSVSNGEVSMQTTDGNGHQFSYQSGTSYVAPSVGTNDSQSITYPTIISLIAQSPTSVGGFYGSSLNSLTQVGSYGAPTSMVSSVYMGIFILAHNTSGLSSTGTLNYLLTRAYPPNGVMPSIKTNLIVISITNNQSSATPAPFQQLITINPSLLGSSNFSADLGNIRFYADSAFTQPLYAWVESGNSNTSTATNIWVKLPNGIPANSSITIYMKLEPVGTEYDGVYMGEAPQLSSTYAQFDNGSNVFNNYWNFAGTVLPSNLTYTVLSNPSGASGSYSVNNGLTITNTNGPDFWNNNYTITLIYYNTPITMPFIAQSYLTSLTGNSSDGGWTKFGLLSQNSITATSTSNGEIDMVTTDGNGHALQWQSGTTYVAPNANTNDSLTITYPIIVSLIAQSSTSIGGFYGNSLNSLTQIGSYVSPTSMASSVYMGIFITSHNSAGASSTGTLNYLLIRAYPPNGVMPNTTITEVVGGPLLTSSTP
ncbi:MAG: hypothetical protein QXU79_04400, partial [Candidatus Micrarchaeaceae archaeon]